MIKGVNRQVVEVCDTESEYFERIMYVVKPEYTSMSEAKLHSEAKRLSGTSSSPPPTKKSKLDILQSIAKLVAAAGVGAAVTAIAVCL